MAPTAKPRKKSQKERLEDTKIAWERASRFRDERQAVYRHLHVEPYLAEEPTVQVWFLVRLGNHDYTDALLRRVDELLHEHPAVCKKEDPDDARL